MQAMILSFWGLSSEMIVNRIVKYSLGKIDFAITWMCVTCCCKNPTENKLLIMIILIDLEKLAAETQTGLFLC